MLSVRSSARRASWEMSSTTPGDQEVGALGRAPPRKASPWSADADLAIFMISRRWASVNLGGCPPAYLGYSEAQPSALKLCSTSRTRSSLVNASPAICATLMRPPPGHDRPGATAYNPPQPVALVIADLMHPHPASHTRQCGLIGPRARQKLDQHVARWANVGGFGTGSCGCGSVGRA